MPARRDQQKQPADQKTERQAADIAEEEPCHRAVERREAERRAEKGKRRDNSVGRQCTQKAENHESRADRQYFGDRHPVDAVHEIHEVEKPDSADEQKRPLDPPGQIRNDGRIVRDRRDHRRHRDRLQQQSGSDVDGADIVDRADERDQDDRRKNGRDLDQRQRSRAQQYARHARHEQHGNNDGDTAALRCRNFMRRARIRSRECIAHEQRMQDHDQAGGHDRGRGNHQKSRDPKRNISHVPLPYACGRRQATPMRKRSCRCTMPTGLALSTTKIVVILEEFRISMISLTS